MTDQTGSPAAEGPASVSASAQRARFRSMPMPSAPFWIALIGVGLVVAVLVLSAHALFTFAIGVVLAFFLSPVVDRLEHRGMPRTIAAVVVVVVTLVIAVILILAGISILITQGEAFLQGLPALLDEIGEAFDQLELPQWLSESIAAVAQTIRSVIAETDWGAVIIGLAQGLLGLLGFLFSLLLLPFFTFYLLKDQPKMRRNFYDNVPAPWRADLDFTLRRVTYEFANYFKAELIVAGIMGVATTIGMFVIGAIVGGPLQSYALLLGLTAAVMEFIPSIGSMIAYVPACIIGLTTSPEAWFLISAFYFIAWNIEGSVLVPQFEGEMVSFSGATVLVLIVIGLAIGGIIGAIVALPLASVVRDVLSYFFEKAQRESLVVEVETRGVPGPGKSRVGGATTDGTPGPAAVVAGPD
jgi:predicted PurR-regulated permease PerM